MSAVPFRRARLGHRLHDLVFGGKQRGAALGLGAHFAKCVEPKPPRIAARLRERGDLTG
jgi:hypothetical protein